MRAEDLFEAMGDLDEELIARSERRVRSGNNRRKYSDLYRFVVVAVSTAAVVFLFLMVREFVGMRGAQNTKSSQLVAKEQEAESDSAVEEAAMDSEALEEEMTPEPNESPEAEAAAQAAEDKQAAEDMQAGGAAQGDAVLTADSSGKANEADAADEGAYEAEDANALPGETETGEADESASDAPPRQETKTAVDLMGDNKGDYVALEYISAEDEARGGAATVPEYTQEGEEILTRALSNGKALPAVAVNTGAPAYYVYLTKKNGKVDTITFYEKPYVSMTNYPGVVMKISEADYEDVMTLFR